LITQVDSVAQDTIQERARLMTMIRELESSKLQIMESGKVKLTALLGEKERLIDQKRELEFEYMQMEDRNDRAIAREELRVKKIQKDLNQLNYDQ
jgi:hypothetical protein